MVSLNDLQSILSKTLIILNVNDSLLIKFGQERALSVRLGMYLLAYFPSWDVDCEYNRVGLQDESKRCSLGEIKRPDIIIHKRGQLGINNNLLWIEVKIQSSEIQIDIDKLKEFTKPPTEERKIQYQYGLSISFKPIIKTVWIRSGEEIST